MIFVCSLNVYKNGLDWIDQSFIPMWTMPSDRLMQWILGGRGMGNNHDAYWLPIERFMQIAYGVFNFNFNFNF